MEPNFDSLYGYPEYYHNIFNTLKTTLQREASPEQKAEQLANDIEHICSKDNNSDPNEFQLIWDAVLCVAQCIPAGHIWQDNLIGAMTHLKQRMDNNLAVPALSSPQWQGRFPWLGMVVGESWNDDPVLYTDRYELYKEHFSRWMNLNAFVARLVPLAHHHTELTGFPVWQLVTALEQYPYSSTSDSSTPSELANAQAIRECSLWIASEWIIRCAPSILNFLQRPITIDESESESESERKKRQEKEDRAFATGPLCGDDVRPFSIERWQFWRGRFVEFIAGAKNPTTIVSDEIVERLKAAVEKMDDAIRDAEGL